MSAVPMFRQADASRSRIDDAVWPDINPLPELQPEEPKAFPFDGLGPIMGPAARAIAEIVQAPDAVAAGSVLAAAALAAQPHADVRMPHGDVCPLSLFIITSAASGDRKSATDKAANECIEVRRRTDAKASAKELAQWRDQQKDRKRGELADPPPPSRALVVSRSTTEGLHHLLKGQSHIGLLSPEGAELLGGHSMREDRRSAAIAWLMKAWSGETLDTLTKSEGLSVLFGRRVTLHTLVQPVILQTLLADPLAQGQGWVARSLIAQPQSLAGKRLFRKAQPACEHPAAKAFHKQLQGLLELEEPLDDDGDGAALKPRILALSEGAEALWTAFYDEIESKQATGEELEGVRPWASKAAEQAARVAGVVTLIGSPKANEISAATMRGALAVIDFYLGEHLRLTGESRERQQLQLLHVMLEWLKQRRPLVKHGEVLQYAPRPVRGLKADGIGKLLEELAAHGYIRRVNDVWEVHPDA